MQTAQGQGTPGSLCLGRLVQAAVCHVSCMSREDACRPDPRPCDAFEPTLAHLGALMGLQPAPLYDSDNLTDCRRATLYMNLVMYSGRQCRTPRGSPERSLRRLSLLRMARPPNWRAGQGGGSLSSTSMPAQTNTTSCLPCSLMQKRLTRAAACNLVRCPSQTWFFGRRC